MWIKKLFFTYLKIESKSESYKLDNSQIFLYNKKNKKTKGKKEMKYKLIKPINSNYSVIEQILTNRNIPLNLISKYLNTTDEVIISPLCFGE